MDEDPISVVVRAVAYSLAEQHHREAQVEPTRRPAMPAAITFARQLAQNDFAELIASREGRGHVTDYSIFEPFCKTPTWTTGHALDEKRFFDCLAEVVDDPSFSAEAMREYIATHHGSPMWPKTQEELDEVLDRLEVQADAIHGYTHRHRL